MKPIEQWSDEEKAEFKRASETQIDCQICANEKTSALPSPQVIVQSVDIEPIYTRLIIAELHFWLAEVSGSGEKKQLKCCHKCRESIVKKMVENKTISSTA